MKKHRLPAAVLALAALGFTLGTCEFVIVGILPDIAAGLNVSLAAVGRLVSVFAACYAVGTPLLTALTGRMDRFRLLMGLMLLFLGVNVLSMLAPGVAVLYASRVVAALVSGTLTAVAMLYAKEVSSPEQTARAISAVYAGFSVAAVAGVPIGTAVCHALGWRATFGVILAMGLVLLPVLARLLPREIDVPPAEGGLLNQFAVLRDSRCWHCVLMVLFSASATYTVYTYLTPTLTGTLGLPETAVSPVLLVMGLCSAASNLFSGCLAEKGGLKPLPLFFAAQVLLFAVLPLLLVNRWLGLTGLFAMGLLMYLLNTPVREMLDKVFGIIPAFKSKKELVNDEFDNYMLTCGVAPGDYYEVRRFFETYLTDKEVRRVIEDGKYQLLGTQVPSYSFADLKRLGAPNMRSVVGYVNDNVNLSRFM